MDRAERIAFTKSTEKMVLPKDVGKLYQRAEMLGRLPNSLQKWIVRKGAGDNPFIGFVVEPYCSFLSYEIADAAAAEAQLPRTTSSHPQRCSSRLRPDTLASSRRSAFTPQCSGAYASSSISSLRTRGRACCRG